MEVILIKDVEKLGYADDIVSVRAGYANNYLIPHGYAKAATESARKVHAETIRQRAHKEAKLVLDAETLAARLAEMSLVIPIRSEDEKIFGTVTPADIAASLANKGIVIDRKDISVEQIKKLGEYEATVRLYKGIKGTVKFSVVAMGE